MKAADITEEIYKFLLQSLVIILFLAPKSNGFEMIMCSDDFLSTIAGLIVIMQNFPSLSNILLACLGCVLFLAHNNGFEMVMCSDDFLSSIADLNCDHIELSRVCRTYCWHVLAVCSFLAHNNGFKMVICNDDFLSSIAGLNCDCIEFS